MAEKVELENLKSFDLESRNGQVVLDGKEKHFDIERLSDRKFLILKNNHTYIIELIEKSENSLLLKINGKEILARYKSQIAQMLESLGMSENPADKVNVVKAPMPGSIIEIMCKSGDEIKKGDSLLILEAMKMENVLKSPGEGIVDTVHVAKGQNVDKNQELITFK